MLTAIDRWISRKLMQPMVIGLCQRWGMTQYAVARYAWMLAMWTLVMRISFEGIANWLFAARVIGMSVWERSRPRCDQTCRCARMSPCERSSSYS